MSVTGTLLPARRLFLALWPPPAVRAAIGALSASWLPGLADRLQPAADLHLTLHFLGQPEAEVVERVGALVCDWPRPSIRLRLVRYGQFRRAGVVWLGPAGTPPALNRLHDDLGRALLAAGCTLERRRFCPHVTLARGIRRPARLPAIRPVDWVAEDLVLAGSVPAGPGAARYRVLVRAGDGPGSGLSGEIQRSAGETDL